MTISNISPKALLVILDGFGVTSQSKSNAIKDAQTPNIDHLLATYPHKLIEPGGEFVGLPKGIVGNSEVGHMNLGSGRAVRQDLVIINESIENDTLKERGPFKKLIEHALSGTKRVHLLGLLSDGGVHSHVDHLLHIHEKLSEYPELEVYFHSFTDGRDTARDLGLKYTKIIQEKGINIASIQGRSFGMDRDRRWEKIEIAYKMITGQGNSTDISPLSFLEEEYSNDRYDEFITPTLFNQKGKLTQGDTVFFLNFRPDRAIQITQALTLEKFSHFDRNILPGHYLCMTPYIPDEIDLPILFDKEKLSGTLTEYLSSLGKKQLKIAETEKYAHVTFFFNGGEKKPFPNEKHILIPSPKEVATYDQKPEMSASEVTKTLVDKISNDEFDFYLVNFANCDMVGHTGSYDAALKAVETVDHCVGELLKAAQQKNMAIAITADHGNCDQMEHDDGSPHTSHTKSKVPFILVHPSLEGKKITSNEENTYSLKDVAPTILNIMGIESPKNFTGKSIFL